LTSRISCRKRSYSSGVYSPYRCVRVGNCAFENLLHTFHLAQDRLKGIVRQRAGGVFKYGGGPSISQKKLETAAEHSRLPALFRALRHRNYGIFSPDSFCP
jgi:hypothetical protein